MSNSIHSIGLEHCLIDTVLDASPVVKRKKPPASVSRQIDAKIFYLVDKYKILSKDKIDKDKTECIIKDIEDVIQLYNKTLYKCGRLNIKRKKGFWNDKK